MKGKKANPAQQSFYHQPPTFNVPKRGAGDRGRGKGGGRSSGRRG